MPIDKVYIDSAVEIRREWVRLLGVITDYQREIDKTKKLLYKKKQDIEDYSKTKPKIKDPKFKEFIENLFTDLEMQSTLLENKISPVSKEMEKLSKEELRLYKVITPKYPNLSDDQIKEELWPWLKDIHL